MKTPDSGECELRFLIVNGESFRLRFPADASVRDVKQGIINARPVELVSFLSTTSTGGTGTQAAGMLPPSRVDEVRILHLGKFLEDDKLLSGTLLILPPLVAFSRAMRGDCDAKRSTLCTLQTYFRCPSEVQTRDA
jgi:Ubiquitin-2 like Rad60 SUMO-like